MGGTSAAVSRSAVRGTLLLDGETAVTARRLEFGASDGVAPRDDEGGPWVWRGWVDNETKFRSFIVGLVGQCLGFQHHMKYVPVTKCRFSKLSRGKIVPRLLPIENTFFHSVFTHHDYEYVLF